MKAVSGWDEMSETLSVAGVSTSQPLPLVATLRFYYDQLGALLEVVKAMKFNRHAPIQDCAIKSLGLTRRILESLIKETENGVVTCNQKNKNMTTQTS